MNTAATTILLTFFSLTLSVPALAAGNPALKINGHAAGSALMVGDQLYVPLSALKAAGVQVSLGGGQVSLNLPGAASASSSSNSVVGGANQMAAQSGCLNQTLSNGGWSVKFSNLHFVAQDPKEYNQSYWALDVRISNLTNQVIEQAFLGGLNAKNITWVGADGNTLASTGGVDGDMGQALTFRRYLPGQPYTGLVTINTNPPVTKDKPPVKLVWQFDPSEVASNMKMPWSSKDPSFRVNLTCSK
ncbi:hypothetical protein GCM10022631_38460 [Deinococcus rubellus]|uniref:hypothetical protein n=1 Tax=Deinococcus rubellus TaxID=1889240 RepID=UPI0031EE8714